MKIVSKLILMVMVSLIFQKTMAQEELNSPYNVNGLWAIKDAETKVWYIESVIGEPAMNVYPYNLATGKKEEKMTLKRSEDNFNQYLNPDTGATYTFESHSEMEFFISEYAKASFQRLFNVKGSWHTAGANSVFEINPIQSGLHVAGKTFNGDRIGLEYELKGNSTSNPNRYGTQRNIGEFTFLDNNTFKYQTGETEYTYYRVPDVSNIGGIDPDMQCYYNIRAKFNDKYFSPKVWQWGPFYWRNEINLSRRYDPDRWLIYPTDTARAISGSSELGYRFLSDSKREFMGRAPEGRVVIWAKSDNGTQFFKMKRSRTRGFFHIINDEKNFLTVGAANWIGTSSFDTNPNSTTQQFMFERTGCALIPNGLPTNIEVGSIKYNVDAIPKPDQIKKEEEDIAAPELYLVDYSIVPGHAINDTRYAGQSPLTYIDQHPYYYLVHEQYYDSSEKNRRGKSRSIKGRGLEVKVDLEIGMTSTVVKSLTKTFGFEFNASGGLERPGGNQAAKKSLAASFKLYYNETATESETIENKFIRRFSHTETFNDNRVTNQQYTWVTFYSLVSRFTLYDFDGKYVNSWEGVDKPAAITRLFPLASQDRDN